jgi:uncharacterized protein YoaH (UPF0181 family)
MAQQTAMEKLESTIQSMIENGADLGEDIWAVMVNIKQAKEMEKQQHEKINKFLDVEKVLGISDLKTIERIQWYYNNYFNETYGK